MVRWRVYVEIGLGVWVVFCWFWIMRVAWARYVNLLAR